MFFDQTDRHAQMAKLDPRDTNGDGVVSPQEAAAYIQDYLAQATPEERQVLLQDYFGSLDPNTREQLGQAIVKSPSNSVQAVQHQDAGQLAQAYTQAAQTPAQNGANSLEAVFGQASNALNNPLVKAGLVGLAGIIGSKLLRR